jgi:hypothetical protein
MRPRALYRIDLESRIPPKGQIYQRENEMVVVLLPSVPLIGLANFLLVYETGEFGFYRNLLAVPLASVIGGEPLEVGPETHDESVQFSPSRVFTCSAAGVLYVRKM